jgi:ubiquinone/menaquinone biosynthesis C-methylase UbiE
MRGATVSGFFYARADNRSAVDREKDFWEQHEEFDWMAEASKRDVVQALPVLRGKVLELCIGSGMLTEHVPRTYSGYVGLDLSHSLLRTLQRKIPHLQLVNGDAEEVCFENAAFDAVLIFAGLHHLPRYEAAVANAYRVLQPGGVFICLEPSSRAWYRKPMELLRDFIGIYSEDEVFLDSRSVAAAMRAVGFRDLEVSFLTPRFSRSFLSPRNRVLAQLLYAAASLGRSAFTQSFFMLRGTKN